MTDEERQALQHAVQKIAIAATLGMVNPIAASMPIALSDVAREIGRTSGWSAEQAQRAIEDAVLLGMDHTEAERIMASGWNPVWVKRMAEQGDFGDDR